MDEVSDIFKRGLEILHKGSVLTKSLESRSKMHRSRRENIRNDLIFERRKINPDCYVDTPEVSISHGCNGENISTQLNYNLRSKNVPCKRLDMLAKWKEQKEKQKQRDADKRKPTFKTGLIPLEIGLPNLSNVNKVIKGKPIYNSKYAGNTQLQIKARNVSMKGKNSIKSKFNGTTRENLKKESTPGHTKNFSFSRVHEKSKIVCHSSLLPHLEREGLVLKDERFLLPLQTEQVRSATPANSCAAKISEFSETKTLCTIRRSTRHIKNNIINNEELPNCHVDKTSISNTILTDHKKNEFGFCSSHDLEATTGKSSIKTDHSTGTEAHSLISRLDNETSRIEMMCQKWSSMKDDPNLPDTAHSFIDVVVGQSKLLISKKFNQFRDLINKHSNKNNVDKQITCDDLHGFWDMMYIQIEDLNKRFDNLVILQKNYWQEITPEKNITRKKYSKKK